MHGKAMQGRWEDEAYVAIAQHPFELEQALSTEYTDAILIEPQTWELPAGANGEGDGSM